MPPRFVYWTILIDGKPTAFRARDQQELLPTLGQLKRTNQDVVMKWFARGKLWDSPEAERAADQRPAFTGEMIYPWMFDDYPALAPLREAADLLAQDASWPMLYDPVKLAANRVPAAAAIYAEDMYVPRVYSEPTAAAIRGMKTWLTNEFEHNGLRTDGERVFGHLVDLVRDRA